LARAIAATRSHPLLTPLFIVFAAINVLGGVFEFRLSLIPINVAVLAAYIALIHFGTKDRPAAVAAVDAPRTCPRDIGLAVTVAILQLTAAVIFWFVIVPHGVQTSWAADLRRAGLPTLVAGRAALAALAVPLLLLPTLVALAAFRVRPREVGLTATPRDLLLGAALAVITIGLGLGAVAAGLNPGLMWQSSPLPAVTAAIAFQSLINGVPEELAYRGVIFSRLMPWLGRPGNSMVISSILFGLFHVPMYVATGISPWLAPAIALFGLGEGLLFAYVFYRTRSIWPGVLWHTSITGVGLIFL
jgi:membrane protease YdiL (CAAX protease family)